MDNHQNSRKRLIRLGQILKIFLEKEKVSSTWMSNHFNTTTRTIQRDLLLLKEAGFPLHEIQKGIYEMNKDLVKNLEVFDDTELALVVALKNIVGQLGQPFLKAADGVFDRLYDVVTHMPIFVKIDESVALDTQLLSKIVKSIRDRKQVCFQYTMNVPHDTAIEPYRIVYFSGFWYLVGKDVKDGAVKRYALDKIKDFRQLKACFKCVPDALDGTLRNSINIWFREERDIDVSILVEKKAADYFRRRRIFPTQEILEEKKDGSLVVNFRVGDYGEIRDILKAWLPHFRILKPAEFRNAFLKDMKQWVVRQESDK